MAVNLAQQLDDGEDPDDELTKGTRDLRAGELDGADKADEGDNLATPNDAPIIDEESAGGPVQREGAPAASATSVAPPDPNAPLPGYKPIVGAPPPVTAAPSVPAIRPGTPGAREKITTTIPGPEAAQATAYHNANTEDAVTAEGNRHVAQDAALKEQAALQARQAVEAREHAERVQKVIDDHDARLRDELAKKQQYFEDAKATPYHDLWAERSTGDRILGAIATFLGGLPGGENKALAVLNTGMQHAYDKQAHDIEQKWKLYEQQSKNVEEAERGKADALTDLKLLQGARYERAAAELVAMKVRQGIPLEQAEHDANVVKIRQQGEPFLQDAAKQTQIKVEQDTYGKVRGAGGGGGGGRNAEKLAQMIQDGHGDGTPLTQAEKIHAATQLGIPVEGKAGQVTLKSINAESVFNADQARKGAKGGLGEDRLVAKEAKDWAAANGLTKIETAQRELAGTIRVLRDNPNNPTAQALAVEKAVSAARGGAASKQALSLALEHLGGSVDNYEGILQKWKTGALGDAQKKNFIDFLTGQLGNAQTEGKEAYDSFNKFIANAPADMKPRLLTSRSLLFSGMQGFGEHAPAAGGSAKPAAAATPAVKVVVPANKSERIAKADSARVAVHNQALSPEQRKMAQDYLNAIGER